MYKLVFFVPAPDLERVKNALFAQGAGRTDKYEACCWQVLGQMQFRPRPASDPAIGEHGQLTLTEEYRVEMLCPKDLLKTVVTELEKIHPYEEPAYEVYQLIKNTDEV